GATEEAGRERLDQEVRRGAQEVQQLGVGQREAPVGVDEQVAVGWRDVDGARVELLSGFGLLDGEPRAPGEDVRDEAAVAAVEMLHDRNGGLEIAGKPREQL